MSDPNLFNLNRVLTPAERRSLFSKTKKTGHAYMPGTGPAGETCGTCENLVRVRMAKTYMKCGLRRATWTSGLATDIRVRDAACKFWKTAQ